jgi:cation-transporting P-type ATPase F
MTGSYYGGELRRSREARLRAVDGKLPWHARPAADILAELGTTRDGLDAGEAARRLDRDGPNQLTRRHGPSALRTLADQFVAPLVIVLLVAAGVSIALGDHVDALVITGVVVVNAMIGFLQERRAHQAIAALDQLIVTEATVIRGGKPRRVRNAELVVGDVVMLQSGDAVPADLRLFEVRDLQVEEAALTGESVPVAKSTAPLPVDTGLGDRLNLGFGGTAVTYGRARGVVVAVGDATEAGRIAELMASTRTLATPLTRRIARLSRTLVWLILGVAAAMFVLEAARGSALATTFNAAVALAVGAIPEGLPAAVTILLAVGVSTMARRRALIRRLPAVETLGSTTVICSDKTGTLTENQMTVTALSVGVGTYEVTGIGYDAVGGIVAADASVDPQRAPAVREAMLAGALCNDTRLVRSPAHPGAGGAPAWVVEGDPTEAALLVAARKAGLDDDALAAWPRLDVVPFESQHMYMATLHEGPDGRIAYVKGSSEALLPRCRDQLDGDGACVPVDLAAARLAVDALAARGLRVLCLARRALPEAERIGHADVSELTLIGFVGMIDPPRPEAARAIAVCRGAGVRVKMITGDHAVTAAAIAAELGLDGARDEAGRLRAVTGAELATADAATLARLAEDVAVFARVAPEQKLLLVRALQKAGHVVAMTGDGVNDAPALKQADIGVGMGKSGTDVARAASAMILTDDNFATIAAAVEEGRGVYDNLVKFIAWTLPTNGGEALVLLMAVVFGAELPVLPVQLLWVNMATAVILGISLVFEPKEPGLMTRPPRPMTAPLLGRAIAIRTIAVSALMAGAAFGFFELAQHEGLSLAQARTIAINTIVVTEVGYLFGCRSLRQPLWRIGLFTNNWVWLGAFVMLLAQLLITYAPFMNRLFHTAPLPFIWWVYATIAGGAIYLLVEAKKVLLPGKAES